MHRYLRRIGDTTVVLPVSVAIAAVVAMVVVGAAIDRIPVVTDLSAGFWVLGALAVFAEVVPLPVLGARRRHPTVFLSFAFTFAITLLWGPILAVLVQTVAVAGAAVRLRFPSSWLVFTIARLAAAFGAAGMVLALFGDPPLALRAQSPRLEVFAVVVAAMTWFVMNYAIFAVWLWTHNPSGWARTFSRMFGNELLATSALLLLAPVFVGARSALATLFVLIPVFAVSQLARLSAEREEQLRHDPLTGLLCRRGLVADAEELAGADAGRGSAVRIEAFALFLLDLDRFKTVNDVLGHTVGDRLLVEVARRLRAGGRPGDLLARIGSDEFAVLAPGIRDVPAAQALAAQLADALAQPARLEGLSLDIGASIGVAFYPDHGRDTATVLRHADVAMYEAKRMTDAFAVYSPHVDTNSPARLSLLAELRGALQDPERHDEIRFHYQPQVAITTGELVGVEALLRWHHPEWGLVNTEEVVRVAEHSSVMRLLTQRALDDVVRQLADWNTAGFPTRASVNVSARDLHANGFVSDLDDLLRRHGVEHRQVELELTETALMADPRMVRTTVQELASLGVGLALDDLGTGYSSLQHLRRLPLTEVKVDRSFVKAMTVSRDDEAIVRSVTQLAHALGLRVVAEGVEDEQTHEALAAAGCDIGQGWHYGPGMPTEELESWLRGRARPQLSLGSRTLA